MAPVGDEKLSEFSSYFEELGSWQAEEIIPVRRYRSKRTGLTVCLAEIEGPVVHGYFCLATEAKDDDGLPHTLEHLIFLGSELYPYKGVLDLIANRCLASGTNAWTDTDHTCYTVVTAGAQGFLQLLPIYLDHILYPILSDAAFITEVHHVNGEGEDAGVVYCEMQGRENTGESLCHLSMVRAMYPEPCGYRYETGGIMKNLRESTTNEKVKDFHKQFYQPENLSVIVTGHIKMEDLLAALLPFEERILTKPARPHFTRPWQTPVPPLEKDVEEEVLYSCDDESNGLVLMAWRGPSCNDLEAITAVCQIAEYLTDSAISPLQCEFVEIEDPYCTTVGFSLIENTETCMCFMFENVPTKKLELLKEKLQAILQAIQNGTTEFDMNRMKALCRRKKLAILSELENDPHSIIAQHLIGDFLYGKDTQDLEKRLNQTIIYDQLFEKSKDYWIELLEKIYVKNNFVLIKGKPSQYMMEKMSVEEKTRIADQRAELGEAGMKQKEDELLAATNHNEIPPPEEMIVSVPVPSISSLHFLTIQRCSNHFPEEADKNLYFPLSTIPVCFLLDDARSNFVQLTALLDTSDLDPESRLYLPLLTEVFLELPLLRDGEIIPHEKVIFQLAEDTVKAVATIGISTANETPRFNCGSFAQIMQLVIKVEMKRYKKGVQWLKDLLFHTQFTADRLKIMANKMVNSVSEMKRTGYTVAQSLIKDLCFGQESNHYASNMMRQHAFLTQLLIKLENEPHKVIETMTALKTSITTKDKMTVHMIADTKRLSQSASLDLPWMDFFSSNQSLPTHLNCFTSVKKCHELLLPLDKSPLGGGIIGLGSVETSFFVQAVPSITSYNHVDLPAIMVLLQYLTQLEGPMWRQIRGLGLAYGFCLPMKPEEGLTYLLLYKCSHVVSAYKEAKRILDDYISGKEEWDEALLDSARSSLIFEIIEHEKSITDVSHESLLSYFRGVELGFNRELLEKVSQVTAEDLKRVGIVHVSSLVSGNNSHCSVCCHSSKIEEIRQGFKEASCDLQVIPSLENSFLSRL